MAYQADVTKIWVMIIEGRKMRISDLKIRATFHIETL